ncbi:MAG TPA: hypothetical protein VFW83_06085 [Bryobacteraceae bacterium]|nr:hypothetical protein [Bryobacteraceae bacterium]
MTDNTERIVREFAALEYSERSNALVVMKLYHDMAPATDFAVAPKKRGRPAGSRNKRAVSQSVALSPPDGLQ